MRKNRVKELAQARGLTQMDLYAKAKGEVSLTVIQRLWQNRAAENTRHKNIEAIARALDVSVEELFVRGAETEQLPPSDKRMSLAGATA